jgi:hypothetical protein
MNPNFISLETHSKRGNLKKLNETGQRQENIKFIIGNFHLIEVGPPTEGSE